MTIARKQQIDLTITPYYHCVSRCVRRSFLCGKDPVTNQSYEHRRHWIEQRIHQLAHIYCIDICSYSVMSNHYHLVVHINKEKAEKLTDLEVVERWSAEHKIDPLITQFKHGLPMDKHALRACMKVVELWRERLSSLSWMMKELNMSIALMANREDKCTGHFWEGRFRSHALLDETALLAAMAYVDLNPVRAGIEVTPEQSKYTSIKLRVTSLKEQVQTPTALCPFKTSQKGELTHAIPYNLRDYLELVNWIAKYQTKTDSVTLDSNLPDIFSRLDAQVMDFLNTSTQLEQKGYLWIGSQEKLSNAKRSMNKKRLLGLAV
ncbi:transposase [Vibrio nitrifigilis]|uniref:Transposase n=1 Tax=Vibrio nitrifigilis TaxID=2789781 RepID=A0ABS0GCU9_9VIBR|nr:transposase [Vibrio nitrifigilis]MBF9000216.1 transposase [Vibrio nitrifigilis]